MSMNCREFVDFLMDYLDGQLPPEQLAVFQRHMDRCPPCVAYLQSYQQSVLMGKAVCTCPEDDVPDRVPEQLVHAILEARRKGNACDFS
jgi:anti-sigma factor RsiW